MNLGNWSNHLAVWVTAIAAMAGGYQALTAYVDSVGKQVDERKLQVFNLHARFTSEPMLSIRERVYAEVLKASGCNDERGATHRPSTNDRFTFVEFFDVVHACVDGKLCDADLVERLFAPYANGHWPYLGNYVVGVRKAELAFQLKTPFGIGLEKLATRPAKMTC